VQVTLQVDPEEHEILPLSPMLTSHVDPVSQLMLHDWPQVPEHVLPIPQSKEQLCPLPHELEVKVHVVPEAHLQLAPEHCAVPP
jgi:hypothetical protein